jgi:hypothetical protein
MSSDSRNPIALVDELNRYPMPMKMDLLDPTSRTHVITTINNLVASFRRASFDERRRISARLDRQAEYLLAEYTKHQSLIGRQSRSRDCLLDGLTAIVIANGTSTSATGGTLLSFIYRSCEAVGIDAVRLFAEAAVVGTDETSVKDIAEFPHLPEELRGIERFGFREVKTAEGVSYVHKALYVSRFQAFWDWLRGRKRLTDREVQEILQRGEGRATTADQQRSE